MPMRALPDAHRHTAFYADVPTKRAMAWVIDTMLITALTAMIVPFTAFTALFFLPFLYLTVSFATRWASLAILSATPGMVFFGITLRDRDGYRLDQATAFAHTLGYTLSFAFVLPQVISAALMIMSPRAQGLADLVLGTVAINRAARH